MLIDEYAAEIVRRIFQMRVDGIGLAKIAATLNNEGILSPRAYSNKWVGKDIPPNKVWTSSVVKGILVNESYIGHAVRFKKGRLSYKNRLIIDKPKDEWVRCENVFPAIIDIETWNAVEKLKVKQPATSVTKERKLFTSLLRCADCGSRLTYRKNAYTIKSTGQKLVSHTYNCPKYHHSGGSACSKHFIKENVLLAIVSDDIKKQLEESEINVERVTADVQKSHVGSFIDKLKNQKTQLTSRLEELSSVGKKLYEDRLNGIISIDTFKMLYENAEEERAKVKIELNCITEAIVIRERLMLDIRLFNEKLQEFLSLETPTNEVLSALIDHVVVHEGRGHGKDKVQEVEIVYRY